MNILDEQAKKDLELLYNDIDANDETKKRFFWSVLECVGCEEEFTKHLHVMTKFEALVQFFKLYIHIDMEPNNIDFNHGVFKVGLRKYIVLTNEEADKKAYENIEKSVWSLRSDFIMKTCNLHINDAESLKNMQKNMCEECNNFIKAMIEGTCGMKKFVETAVKNCGREYFIATYDKQENVVGDYFIYRIK